MSSRKKLIVSLSVVALVVIAAVVAVVGVFAATTQNVQSNIYVTFTAVDIEGSVIADYKVQVREEEGKLETTGRATTDEVEFKAMDSTTTGAMAIGSETAPLDIKGRDQALYIEYTFERASVDYKATVSFSSTVFYAEIYLDGEWTTLGGTSTEAFATFGTQNTTVVTMRISVLESVAGTSVEATTLNLNWTLTAA